MKILHIEDFFHPDAGYQVNQLSKLQSSTENQIYIICADMNKTPVHLANFFGKENISNKDLQFYNDTGVTVIRAPVFGFYSGRAVYKPFQFIKILSKIDPDVALVHGESTLIAILLIIFSKYLKFPIILDSHMLDMASKNRFKRYFQIFYSNFITPIIIKKAIPLIRVVDSDFVEKNFKIPLNRTILLSFGTDTDYFKPNSTVRNLVRKVHGISLDCFLVLYAGKLDETKGGIFLAKALKNKIMSNKDVPIEFLIIGNNDAINKGELEELFSSSSNKIIRLDTQRYCDLAKFYQAADLVIFPKQCSMSFFEAQSCGIPVLFEDNEINCQRANHNNAFIFNRNDAEDFRLQISRISSIPEDEINLIKYNSRKFILDNFNYAPIAKKFTDILQLEYLKFKK